MKWSRKAVVAAAFVLTGLVARPATGETPSKSTPWATDDGGSAPVFSSSLAASTFASTGQHGGASQHLPAVRENIEVVGKLKMQTPAQYKFAPGTPPTPDPTQPDVVPGQIADVAVYKNAAYLASWSEPSCKRGGFFSVRDLAWNLAGEEHVVSAVDGDALLRALRRLDRDDVHLWLRGHASPRGYALARMFHLCSL
jgi:hypothetical protein